MRKLIWLLALMVLPGRAGADRYAALLSAKNVVLTTTKGQTYYYMASSVTTTLMELSADSLQLNGDRFAKSEVRSVRVKNIGRFLLDEDAQTFDSKLTMSHAILALRRSMVVGQWNSLVLPVSLTGNQVRDAFGEDAILAQVRGFRENDNATIEFETIDLNTADVVMQANAHYLLQPSRQPDVAPESKANLGTGMQPYGPIYLIADAALASNQSPSTNTIRTTDRSAYVSQRGTYTVRDGSTTAAANKKVPGTHPLYQLDDEGRFAMHTDSVVAKAFTSWIYDMRKTSDRLDIYIDGISLNADGISLLVADPTPADTDRNIYDMQGRRVGTKGREAMLPKGLYIIDGKKHIIK